MNEEYSYLIPDFVAESQEHLEHIENDILGFENKLQDGNFDGDLINNIFRAIHSIKGGASFIELVNIEKLSHKMEDILDLIRNQKINLNSKISNALLKSIDQLKKLLDDAIHSNEIDVSSFIELLDSSLNEEVDEDLKNDLLSFSEIRYHDLILEFDVSVASMKERVVSGNLFIICLDMIKDMEEKNISPLHLVKEMNQLGELMDAKINLDIVSSDLEYSGSLELLVLYFSPMEIDMVSYALGISDSKITQLKNEDFINLGKKEEVPLAEEKKETKKVATLKEEEPTFEEMEISQEDLAEKVIEYITFVISGEEYGIEILKIQEIIGYQSVSKIPNSPEHVKGMLNLRGTIVPIFDIRERFKMENIEITPFTVIIIAEISGKTVGLIVDSVADIVSFKGKEVQEAMVAHTEIQQEFIRGVGKKDKRMIIILEYEKLFETVFEELVV